MWRNVEEEIGGLLVGFGREFSYAVYGDGKVEEINRS